MSIDLNTLRTMEDIGEDFVHFLENKEFSQAKIAIENMRDYSEEWVEKMEARLKEVQQHV